jgi:hypothetical protein
LATGAIRAGIGILLRQAGLQPKDLERVLIGGGFGNFIRRNNAYRASSNPGPGDLIHRHRLDFRTGFSIQKADQFPATPVLASPCANDESTGRNPAGGVKDTFAWRCSRRRFSIPPR